MGRWEIPFEELSLDRKVPRARARHLTAHASRKPKARAAPENERGSCPQVAAGGAGLVWKGRFAEQTVIITQMLFVLRSPDAPLLFSDNFSLSWRGDVM